jgi:hypothetical protein
MEPTPARTPPAPSGLSQHAGGDGGAAGLTADYAGPGAERMAQRDHAETSSVSPSVEEVVDSPGQPLDEGVRSLVEPRLGHDFSRVRVRTDAQAAESARSVDAAAYTVGSDIVFASGAYRPQTPRGMQLITHELVHVTQHQVGSAPADAPLSSDVSDPAEQQADNMTQRLSSGLPDNQWSPVAPSSLLSLAPETWYRGEVTGVAVAKDASAEAPGVIHDLGDGKYFTDRLDVAKEYAEMRASNAAMQRVLKGQIDPHSLGKVLDLTKEPDFMTPFKMVKQSLGNVSGEPYRGMVDGFLQQKGLKLEDFDIIIGPEGIRDGNQMCIRNAKTIAKVMGDMALVKPGGKGGGGGPGSGPTAADDLPPTVRTPKTQQTQELAVEPPTGGTKPPAASATEPPAGGVKPNVGPGRAGRVAIGVGKFAGPIILDLVNRYFMAKAEHERAVAQISARVESAETQQWIADLVEKQRLEIARKQYRGGQVYATVSMKLAFTNDVLDQLSLTGLKLSDKDESNMMSSVMSHGAILGDTGSVWWVDVSLPLPQVELSKSEAIKFHLEMMEENAPGEISPERKRLLGEMQRTPKRERGSNQS